MKCVKCSADNNLKDREASKGHCKNCQHLFVFDKRLKKDTFLTDKLFEKAIALASVNNTLKFTKGQFYYYINGMKALQTGDVADLGGCALVVISIFAGLMIFSAAGDRFDPLLLFPLAFLIFGLSLFGAVQRKFGKFRNKSLNLSYHTAGQALERWEKVNGSVGSLLLEPNRTLPRGDVAKELLDYSFDRVIVTDTDQIAQFLIANNFHFENNCAVLSINQYPSNLFDTIMMMLRNNPELKVYALHNCSWLGISILDRLKTEDKWFKNQPNAQIIDLGLLPRQIQKRAAFVEFNPIGIAENAAKVPDSVKKSLTAEELRFLDDGKMVALESIPPRGLLRMITMGIAMSKDPSKKDALVAVDGGTGSGGSDVGVFMFAGDSFG